MPSGAPQEQATTCPLPHHELLQLQRVAAQAWVRVDPGRQGHDPARAAWRSARTSAGIFRCGDPFLPVDRSAVQAPPGSAGPDTTPAAQLRCLKASGERIMARDPDRQTTEIRIRIALINRFNALGTVEGVCAA
jgi:hypothetical protein